MHAQLIEIQDRLDRIERMLGGIISSPDWLTREEASIFLRCSIRHIANLTAIGLLPCYPINPTVPNSPRLYHRRHLAAFLVTGRNPLTHPPTPDEKREIGGLL